MCGTMGSSGGLLPAKAIALPDAAPSKLPDASATAGANGGPTGAPTGLGSVVDQITAIEHTLESLIASLQGGPVAGGGATPGKLPTGPPVPADAPPGLPGQSGCGMPGQVGGASGDISGQIASIQATIQGLSNGTVSSATAQVALGSPVQQVGQLAGGGPTGAGLPNGSAAGLRDFVQQGNQVLQRMQQLAQQNAAAHGGNYSQSDLTTIQQRRAQVQTAGQLADFLDAHPAAAANPAIQQMVNLALANSDKNKGNFSASDIGTIKLRVLQLEGKVSPAAIPLEQSMLTFVQHGQDVLQKMTNLALANADRNGGNFNQSDLAVIQQRQNQITGVNFAAKTFLDHADKVTPDIAAHVNQLIQLSNSNGGDPSQLVAYATQWAASVG